MSCHETVVALRKAGHTVYALPAPDLALVDGVPHRLSALDECFAWPVWTQAWTAGRQMATLAWLEGVPFAG